jgi:hypothetical protein
MPCKYTCVHVTLTISMLAARIGYAWRPSPACHVVPCAVLVSVSSGWRHPHSTFAAAAVLQHVVTVTSGTGEQCSDSKHIHKASHTIQGVCSIQEQRAEQQQLPASGRHEQRHIHLLAALRLLLLRRRLLLQYLILALCAALATPANMPAANVDAMA